MKLLNLLFPLLVFFISCTSSENKKNEIRSASHVNPLDFKTYCTCEHFTDSSLAYYFTKRDSIAEALLKENDTIIVLGFHEAFERLLFMTNRKKQGYTMTLHPENEDNARDPGFTLFKDTATIHNLWDTLHQNLGLLGTLKNVKGSTAHQYAVYTVTVMTKTAKSDYCICSEEMKSNASIERMLYVFLGGVVRWVHS